MRTPLSGSSAAAVSLPLNQRRRLGEVLVDQGVVTEEQVAQALKLQADVQPGKRRKRLGAVIIEAGFATDREIAEALAT